MLRLVKENTKIALGAIRSQLLRTVITVFIIAIGIWALVGILSVVSALKNTLLEDYSSMGANTFSISQYDYSARITKSKSANKPNPIISYAEAKAFKTNYNFPAASTSISFDAAFNIEVKHESQKTNPEIRIIGADENYFTNSGLKLATGRSFTDFDLSNNSYVCVVGSDFANGLFKNTTPIGKILSVRGTKFTVIGILKEKGSTFGNNEDLRVFIPLPIARAIFSKPDIDYEIKVSIRQEMLLDQGIDQATVVMRNIRKVPPTHQSNFGIERSDDLINTLMSQVSMLNISAWLIGIITILGSSIALMNIMLVSVTERTREIGIRKSLGAKRSTIAWQFFTETLVIGQLGGLLGTLLGIATGYGISTAIHFAFTIPWVAIIAAFITTFVVAIVSGSYPAIKASRLDPVEALRYE